MLNKLITGDLEQLTIGLEGDGKKDELIRQLDSLIIGQSKAKVALVEAII